jgi:hypothetical protein
MSVHDDPFDLLAAELDVKPGPAFVAKVRMAVQARPPRSAWAWTTAAGAVAILGLSVLVAPRLMRAPEVRPVERAVGPAPVSSETTVPTRTVRQSAPRSVHSSAISREPEVLIPAEQAALLKELADLLRAGVLDQSSLPQAIVVADAVDTPQNDPAAPDVIRKLILDELGGGGV